MVQVVDYVLTGVQNFHRLTASYVTTNSQFDGLQPLTSREYCSEFNATARKCSYTSSTPPSQVPTHSMLEGSLGAI
jgi:hypothetical protein